MKTLIVVLIIALAIILVKDREKHTTWKDRARLIFAFALIPVSVGVAFLTKGLWNFLVLTNPDTAYLFGTIPGILIVFSLSSLTLVSFAAYGKKGFGNLNKLLEDGIIKSLIEGIICGLMVLFVLGAIEGFIFGLTSGLAFALFYVLIIGWPKEFKKRFIITDLSK